MDRAENSGVPMPISVKVNNFPESARVRKTTLNTYVLDPAATDVSQRSAQIGEYEPTRVRTVIQVLDQPCTLIVGETPRASPDTAVSGVGVKPNQGRLLPASTSFEYVLQGPDIFWLNTVTGATVGRVTVTKEYL